MGNTESHDILINPPTPERQQVKILKNETAYRWFYVAMGFAGLVLILLIIGFLWTKRKSKDREREEMRNFPFTSPPDSGHPCLQQDSSIFDPQSMITSPVQPRSEHLYDKMSYPYPIPTGHIGRPMTFGSYKLQPPNENIHLQMQNEALLETLEKKRTSGISLGRNDSSLYIPGRHDSLDAYYALDPAQKSHLQTKMEESTQFTSYLHLTSDITRIDSVDVDDSDTSTVSFSNQTKPNFSQ